MERDFDWFVERIREKSGIDLNKYKRPQMLRRLSTLKDKYGCSSFEDYFFRLNTSEPLYLEFLDRMTIGVTEFFRNESRWTVLQQEILPDLIKRQGRRLRVWSAACSTGEEPYSIVMTLSTYIPLSDIQVLATDIDNKSLEYAEKGVYPDKVVESVPSDIKHRFFTPYLNTSSWQIQPQVRDAVTFRKHNLLEDPFEKDFDLIVCRNVVIYFTESSKNQLYHSFSTSLRPGGILFTGSTEQIFSPQLYSLEPVDTFFYQRISVTNGK